MQKSNRLHLILGITAFIVVVGIFIGLYVAFGPKKIIEPVSSSPDSSAAGSSNTDVSATTTSLVYSKTIVVDVVQADSSKETFTLDTNAESLKAALEQYTMIEGQESQYGFFVTKVNGVTADSKSEFWGFYKNGEMLQTGVDQTPIADGEHYEIVLSKF